MSLIADPGVVISIPARSHTFVEIGREQFSIHSTPSADLRRAVVKNVQEVLVYCLVKLAQEKVWPGKKTVCT